MGRGQRGKATGQIDKLKGELERNARLFNVFSICHELGIDDPIHWMNNTSPLVVDWWVSYLCVKSDRERAAYDDSSSGKVMDPAEAGEYLSSITSTSNVK